MLAAIAPGPAAPPPPASAYLPGGHGLQSQVLANALPVIVALSLLLFIFLSARKGTSEEERLIASRSLAPAVAGPSEEEALAKKEGSAVADAAEKASAEANEAAEADEAAKKAEPAWKPKYKWEAAARKLTAEAKLQDDKAAAAKKAEEEEKRPKAKKEAEEAGEAASRRCMSADAERMAAAGVPPELAEGVAALSIAVGAGSGKTLVLERELDEPLCDPLTLLRFYNAREQKVTAAAAMHEATRKWRAENLPKVMAAHGTGASYSPGTGSLAGPWLWRRDRAASPDAEFAARHGFFGLLDAPAPADGAPVAVWRFASTDLAGLKREGHEELMLRAFISHLENLLQLGRVVSIRQGRLVRARLVLDLKGAGPWMLRHRDALKRFIDLGKNYFPEVSASVTIVRAPWAVAGLYSVVEQFMPPAMRRKVRILGDDFSEGLKDHAGIERAALPAFLGGGTADSQIGAAEPVPIGK